MSARQGSASFTIVLGALTAIVVSAIILTFVFYPIVTAFMGSAMWSAETAAGSTILTYTGGLWEFWAAILLMAILSFVWVRTRQ